MIGETVRHYQNKNTDQGQLKENIQQYLTSEGFKVQASTDGAHGTVLQAKKGGFLQGTIAADRALTVFISGAPNDFTVRVGIGKWLEHLSVTAVEVLLLSELFLLVDVPEMLWNFHVENNLVKKIDALVS